MKDLTLLRVLCPDREAELLVLVLQDAYMCILQESPLLPMLRRRLFLLLSAAILLPLLMQSISVSASHRFSDVPDEAWFTTFVELASDLGIVGGYRNINGGLTGTFGPENSVTVAEALKMALESAGYDISRGVGYGHWAAQYMSVAAGENFELLRVQNLNIDRAATRAEVASLFADAFKVPRSTPRGTVFSDVTVHTPFVIAIESLVDTQILTGDTDASGNRTGRFRPLVAVNRAETVKIAMEARAFYGTPGRYASSSSFSASSSLSSSRLSSSSSVASVTHVIRYSNTGFSPSFLAVRSGDKIRFRNESNSLDMWVASNPHPTHTDYPEFDAHTSIGKNGEYTFTFNKIGTWSFHNHMQPNHQGVVSVNYQ